jgi:glycosyltransferase involved in cell wall biosynthesis
MRVVVLTSSYPRFKGDGTAPFVLSISEEMARLGHDIEVVAPYDPQVNAAGTGSIKVHRFRYIWPEQLHIMGHARALREDVKLNPIAFVLLPFFLIAAFFKLMSVTQEQKSQIIHVHWVLPNGFIAAIVAGLRKIPFVISLHGSDIYVAKRYRLFGYVAKWIFHRATAVTACSPELNENAITLGASNGISLIPWGADPTVFRPTFNKSTIRQKFGWEDNDFIVVALGRMVPKKGFKTLIDLLPKIADRIPKFRLAIGGDGPLRNTLRRQAEELRVTGYVSFPGSIPWGLVPDFLAAADIFVLPSVRDKHGNVDGLPTVLLEAMGCGIAVIASDIGGVRLVVNDNHNGLLVPAGDVEAITNAIICLAEDPRKREILGEAARKSIEEQFNWRSIAERIISILEQAIKERM